MAREADILTIENAELAFRNFAGKEGQYNKEGDRNFCILLDEDNVKAVENAGYTGVKRLKPREEGELGTAYIQVAVNFKGRPPKLSLINSKGRTHITESECEILDWVDIANADVIINPYPWAVSGKSGVKAYLKNLVITIDEDELDRKYADIPDIDADHEDGEVPF